MNPIEFNDLYKSDKAFQSLIDSSILLGQKYVKLRQLIDADFLKSTESINSLKLTDIQKIFKNAESSIMALISSKANELVSIYLKE